MYPKLVSLTVALVLLVGCSGSDPVEGSAKPSSSTTPSSAAASTAEPAASPSATSTSSDGGSGSPIDELLGVPIMDDAAMNDYAIELLIEGERETATCMIAEGFEYTPVVPSTAGPTTVSANSDREQVEKYGFGIVDAFLASTYDGTSQSTDRNSVYLGTLSEGELDAYTVALYGSPADEETSPFGFGGCKALAAESLFSLFTVLEDFDAPAQDVFEQWQADPRMEASRATWSRCMADEGYVATDIEEIGELVINRLIPIIEDDTSYVAQDEIDDPGLGELADWSFLLAGESFGLHPPLTTAAQALVDQVGVFERELAVANFDCYEPHREDDLAIQREYEQQLVDEIGPAVLQALEGQ